MIDAVELEAPLLSADHIHANSGSRPADEAEIAAFHDRFGPFEIDSEG